METKKFAIHAIKLIEPRELRTVQQVDYRQMIADMDEKAKEHGREPLDDIFRIISLYHTHGANIDKLIELPSTSGEIKISLITLKSIYGLKISAPSTECTPTLARVADAFPHVSLVIADMLNSAPGGSRLRFCSSPKDLGAEVHFHFKMNYFSSLIDTSAGWKAQIALLVHNLCHSKSILKTGGAKEIGAAFSASCKISANMRNLRLAPADARQKFTEYITESFTFDADSLSRVWDQVIGSTTIFLCGTLITPFHEQVLNEQPLNLSKWRDLLDRIDPN